MPSFLDSIEKIPFFGGIIKGVDVMTQVTDGLLFGYYGVGREIAQKDLADSPALIIAGSVHVVILSTAIDYYIIGGGAEDWLLTAGGIIVTETSIGFFTNRKSSQGAGGSGIGGGLGGIETFKRKISDQQKDLENIAQGAVDRSKQIKKELDSLKPLPKIDPKKAPTVKDQNTGKNVKVATAKDENETRQRVNENTKEISAVNDDVLTVSELALEQACSKTPKYKVTSNIVKFGQGIVHPKKSYKPCPKGYNAVPGTQKQKAFPGLRWKFDQTCQGYPLDEACLSKKKADLPKNVRWTK